MDISAIICTHRRYDTLPRALDSVLTQVGLSRPREIIVVDNSPDEVEARRFASRYAGRGITFLHEKVANLSNARNVGAAAASGRIVAYLDDDATAEPGWAASLVAAFSAFENVAVAGGPVRPRWGAEPPPWIGARARDLLSLVDRGENLRVLEPHEWLAGCNIAYNRDALLRAGGFSAHLGRSGASTSLLGNEERAVCEKLTAEGMATVYAPGARVEHLIAADRLKTEWFIRRVAWQAISDALADPQGARKHVEFIERAYPRWAKIKRSIKAALVIQGLKTNLTDRDIELLYDFQLVMACGRFKAARSAS